MADSAAPRVVFAEWLHAGVVVHFDAGETVFFPAPFLYHHRHAPENEVFLPDKPSSSSTDGPDS